MSRHLDDMTNGHECIIGLFHDDECMDLYTFSNFQDYIECQKECGRYDCCDLQDYFDKQKNVYLERFTYCPECGKKIDWNELKRISIEKAHEVAKLPYKLGDQVWYVEKSLEDNECYIGRGNIVEINIEDVFEYKTIEFGVKTSSGTVYQLTESSLFPSFEEAVKHLEGENEQTP